MEGYEVVALDVSSDVPGAVEQEKPDVLFMDVHLGKQNGLKIMQTIRNNPETAAVRVVMTSGLNVKDECMKSGADHFLLKPFMPDDLLKLLK